MRNSSYKKTKNNRRTIKQKGGFLRHILVQIRNLKNDDQSELACILRKNSTMINTVYNYLFSILNLLYTQICKKDKAEFSNFLYNNISQKADANDDNIITRIGFNRKEIDKIIQIFTAPDSGHKRAETAFNNLDFIKTKIHATTACFTNLNNPSFQALYIMNDSDLFSEFIEKLKSIFNLPNNYSTNDFLDSYKKISDNKTKDSFNMLIVKTLHTSNNVLGAIQLNYGREMFTRRDRPADFIKTAEDVPRCFNDIKTDGQNEIYGVGNFLDTDNTFIKSIFKEYGRNLVGGISGSAYYFYFLVFKILKREKTHQNLTNALCIMILDYVPLWHSLEEILLTVSVEFAKFGFKEYKMDKDPMRYLEYILGIAGETERDESHRLTPKKPTPKSSRDESPGD